MHSVMSLPTVTHQVSVILCSLSVSLCVYAHVRGRGIQGLTV